jgi:hypothetical protein
VNPAVRLVSGGRPLLRPVGNNGQPLLDFLGAAGEFVWFSSGGRLYARQDG